MHTYFNIDTQKHHPDLLGRAIVARQRHVVADAFLRVVGRWRNGRIVIAVGGHPQHMAVHAPDLPEPLQGICGELPDRVDAEPPQMAVQAAADAEHLVDAERPEIFALVVMGQREDAVLILLGEVVAGHLRQHLVRSDADARVHAGLAADRRLDPEGDLHRILAEQRHGAGHIDELLVDRIGLDQIAEALEDRRDLQGHVDILLHMRPDDDDFRAFAHGFADPFGGRHAVLLGDRARGQDDARAARRVAGDDQRLVAKLRVSGFLHAGVEALHIDEEDGPLVSGFHSSHLMFLIRDGAAGRWWLHRPNIYSYSCGHPLL